MFDGIENTPEDIGDEQEDQQDTTDDYRIRRFGPITLGPEGDDWKPDPQKTWEDGLRQFSPYSLSDHQKASEYTKRKMRDTIEMNKLEEALRNKRITPNEAFKYLRIRRSLNK
jgi:hypothetical protein